MTMLATAMDLIATDTVEAPSFRSDARDDARRVEDVLDKARCLAGLDEEEVGVLAQVRARDLRCQIWAAAREVKEAIYGSRVVLFAPLYVSSHCANECTYCAFRGGNRALERRALGRDEIVAEVRALLGQGHKRVLLVAGEAAARGRALDYVLDAIETAYSVSVGGESLRRINVNVAPLDVAGFRRLKGAAIGTYQLFQETYHRPTYEKHHVAGPKADYGWRLSAMDRAMEAGIDDVGIGALFGLYDWRFEVRALLRHARHLERRFGCGPHTISVPRIEPATGSDVAHRPPQALSDDELLTIIAILRLAVPYTGIILSTREAPELRRQALHLGVSQISAGSRTDPGGYARGQVDGTSGGQFQLGDHRTLDEVIRDVATMGFIPSFCTACYRLGRTGQDFMDLAKPGEIKAHCDPNALSTFQEYLLDHASVATRAVGEALVADKTAAMPAGLQVICRGLTEAVRQGRRDVLV